MNSLKEKVVEILKTKHPQGSMYYTNEGKVHMRNPKIDPTDEEVAQIIINLFVEEFKN